jgi:polysaccharide biosynthesis transport protein
VADSDVDLSESIRRLLNLVVRRRWWILLTACAGALGAIGVLSRLPNRYSSEATLVMQQQVQRYVLPGALPANAEVVQAITRQVLSRKHLAGIISQFGLYANTARNVTPEGLAELLRRDIEIESLDPQTQSDFNAFKISFAADSPQLAQRVTSGLTQFFIDENLRTREARAESTSNFLSEQLQTAKEHLAEQERRLRDFKLRYSGELPEQQTANATAMAELRMELQSTTNSLDRVRQQRRSLESLVGGNLARLQSERATLLIRYTPRHADVVRKDREIAQTESVLKVLKGELSAVDGAQRPPAAADPAVAELLRQAEANARELEELSKQETRLRSAIAQSQSRQNLAPIREQELTAISRDYELSRQQYADLLGKQQQSQLATSLEEGRGSVEFRLLDPPSLPVKPSSPKRTKISLGGLIVGIGLGMALAFLANVRDRSFREEKAVRERFALPLVVAVPLLLTASEERSRTWKRTLEWFAGSVMVVGVLIAELYVCRGG